MNRFMISFLLLFCTTSTLLASNVDTVKIVSYNVGAFTKDGEADYQTFVSMLKELEPSAICLNELDRVTGRSQNIDQLLAFTTLMGAEWDYVFGSAMPFDGGDYGSGISSSDEIIRKLHTRLPKGDGSEPRVLAVIETPNYVLATTHLDHISLSTRLAQIQAINAFIANNFDGSTKPIFLGGDLNDTPNSETLREIEKNWRVISTTQGATYPADKPEIMIDYILQYRDGVECEVLDTQVLDHFESGDVAHTSDHLPIMVEVVIR